MFVTGATGKQGASLVRHMLGRGWNLRALTRDPGTRAAKELADQGVEIVRGDLEDLASGSQAARTSPMPTTIAARGCWPRPGF